MEKYVTPVIEIVDFEFEDVIATSGCSSDTCKNDQTGPIYGPDV